VDCSALTQAGYIGTDIESSIERLLLAAGNSVQKCETGIIFFDEVDKLAKPAVMTHGRDVSGEGVQQGLLKMIEGTTVTVNAKSDRTSKTESSPSRVRDRAGREATSGPPPASGKSEQCTIDTRNILFVFAGAFVGLEKIIASRLSSGSSIGFGAQLKSDPPSPSSSSSSSSSPTPPNPLDAVLPTDLQTYGLIPELLGRIPVITSLHPLTQSQLVSILTEPRNSLVKQYTALFNTYGIQLRFTTPALHAIAARALTSSNPSKSSSPSSSTSPSSTPSGIGARGLRATLESVLGEIMFWGPGSGIRFCLVDEAFVRAGETSSSSPPTSSDREREKDLPPCWSRGQGRLFEDAYEKEEEAYRRRERGEREDEQGVVHDVQSFERYREVGRSGM
jgi:ATP-dependent Clp protease ATP-binding subunit ClpX